MAELVILGSGSGFATKERFSTSIALLTGQNLYLLDCGEPCGALLFRHGIDALALKALFVSHMHPDHVGGLVGLLSAICLPSRSSARKFQPWSINRNDPWYRAALSFPPRPEGAGPLAETRPEIRLVLPSEAINPVRAFLPAVRLAPSRMPIDLIFLPVVEGPTFADDLVRVTAAPNTHMSGIASYAHLRDQYPHLALQSYSYAVEVEGRKFVYSGDISALTELDPLLAGAEVLIVEVAHYDPADIGPFVRNLPLKRVILSHIHPGLEARLLELVRSWGDPRIQIAHDGLRLPLSSR